MQLGRRRRGIVLGTLKVSLSVQKWGAVEDPCHQTPTTRLWRCVSVDVPQDIVYGILNQQKAFACFAHKNHSVSREMGLTYGREAVPGQIANIKFNFWHHFLQIKLSFVSTIMLNFGNLDLNFIELRRGLFFNRKKYTVIFFLYLINC